MSPLARIALSAFSDFVIAGGGALSGYMVGQNGLVWPSPAMWLVTVVSGGMAAARHVQALLAEPPK